MGDNITSRRRLSESTQSITTQSLCQMITNSTRYDTNFICDYWNIFEEGIIAHDAGQNIKKSDVVMAMVLVVRGSNYRCGVRELVTTAVTC